MSDNPLSGYSDAEALRLLWDMAAGVRLDLEAKKRRIAELEAKLNALPLDEIRVLIDALDEDSGVGMDDILLAEAAVGEWLEQLKQQQ